MRVLIALFAMAGVAHAADAGPPPSGGVIDFGDEGELVGGDELTAEPLEPVDRESLMPDRYQGLLDASPAPPAPAPPSKRSCGGCRTGSGGDGALALVVLAAIRPGRRR